MKQNLPEEVRFLVDLILEKKGEKVIVINVKEISPITDFVIIAEATVDRHIRAIGSYLIEKMKKKGHPPHREEGLMQGGWAVIDFLDVMVHLFTPELREKYSLERLLEEGDFIQF